MDIQFYKALAPRPVVLISTIDKKGRPNAAPFSFVMPVSIDPGIIAFASAPNRDTLLNIRETKEFVVNVPSENILKGLWLCAINVPRGVNEIERSGLHEEKSRVVKPPRIRECIAWFECKLKFEREMGDHVIVVGDVLCSEIRDELIRDNGNLDVGKARVLMHIGGNEFGICDRALNIE